MPVCEPVAGWFFWFFLVYSVNSIANYFLSSVGKDYKLLCKPRFAPPSWVFPVAWFINFLILSTSAFLIWFYNDGWSAPYWQLIYFIGHMLLLPGWSILFWYLKYRLISFFYILLIVLVTIGNIVIFSLLNLLPGLLLLPYLLWISFAAVLNYSIWKMNKQKRAAPKVSSKNFVCNYA